MADTRTRAELINTAQEDIDIAMTAISDLEESMMFAKSDLVRALEAMDEIMLDESPTPN